MTNGLPNAYLWEYINSINGKVNYFPLTITEERISWADGEEFINMCEVTLTYPSDNFIVVEMLRCKRLSKSINAIISHPLFLVKATVAVYIDLADITTKDGERLPDETIETILLIARGV